MTQEVQQASCLINERATEAPSATAEITVDGSFNRQINSFTTPFGNNPGELPVEAGRYRLLWSAACPWAHRSVIVRSILGLENVISLGTTSPMRPRLPHVDWEFSLDENNVDPVLGIRYMSEIYKKTDPDYTGRPTVPVMVDTKLQIAVNNDYFKLTSVWIILAFLRYFQLTYVFKKSESPINIFFKDTFLMIIVTFWMFSCFYFIYF